MTDTVDVRELRSRSRSPIRAKQEEHSFDDDSNAAPNDIQESPSQNFKPRHYISLCNIPLTWRNDDIKKFLSGAINSQHVTESVIFAYFRKNRIPNKPKVLVVKFSNKEAAEEACELLKDVEMNGKKLNPKMFTVQPKRDTSEKPKPLIKKTIFNFGQDRIMRPRPFQLNFKTQTYGLNVMFLQHLGIKPPLTSRIFINNLSPEVDEQKLDEVFKLAGKIITIHLMRNPDNTSKGKATILYDHPVEAVQAVSMFHTQELLGNRLVVHLDMKKNSIKKTIPSGLTDIGPGLADNGKPIQYVRAHIEIQKIKQEIREWMVATNETNRNSNSANNLLNIIPTWQNEVGNAPNFSAGSNQEVQKLLQGLMAQANLLNVLSGQNSVQNVPAFTGNMGHQSGNQVWPIQGNRAVNTLHSQVPSSFPQNLTNQQTISTNNLQNSNPFKAPQGSMKMPKLCYICRLPSHKAKDCRFRCEICHGEGHAAATCSSKTFRESSRQQAQLREGSSMSHHQRSDSTGTGMFKNTRDESPPESGSDMVKFKNLPPSVSIEDLKNKMQEVGDVKFAELVSYGKAIVRFARVREAEKCIRLFNMSRVDGQEIQVDYI